MARDAWGWTEPPGDPDVAGQPAEFVDLEPNLPGAGTPSSHRGIVLQLPAFEVAVSPRGPWVADGP
jgi:hypothetical protein